MKHKHSLKVLKKPRGPKALYFRCSSCGKVRGYRRIGIFAMLIGGIPFRREFQIYGGWG